MSVVVTGEETVEEIDEVLRHIQTLLADPRINPRRKMILLGELDGLLDSRLELHKQTEE